MSSHHIIREGQEPALLVLDPIFSDSVSALLEWSPTIIADARALAEIISRGVSVEYVLILPGTEDIVAEMLASGQSDVVRIACRDEHHLISNTIALLRQLGQAGVNIIVGDPSARLRSLQDYSNEMSIALTDGVVRFYRSQRHDIEKWYPAGTMLLLLPFQDTQTITHEIAVTDGVVDVKVSGMVRLHSDGPFWVGEKII